MAFESPELPISEILKCIGESDISLTEGDFRKPDPKRWRGIYAKMFEILTGQSIEQVTQSMCREVQMQIEHPEICEEGFAQMAFTICMQRVVFSCGFRAFSLKDMIEPDPKRLRKLLSVFINTTRHYQIRKEYIESRKEHIEKSRSEYEGDLHRNKLLKERLEVLKERQIHCREESQKCQEEQEATNKQVGDLQCQADAGQKLVSEIKLGLAEADSQEEKLRQEMASGRQSIEKLSTKIVQSPERFTAEQERLKKTIQKLKEDADSKEKIVFENRRLLEHEIHRVGLAQKVLKLAKEVQADLEEENDSQVEVWQLKEKHNELQEKHKQLFLEEEDLLNILNVRQEQLRKVNAQTDARSHSTHQKLNETREFKDKSMESYNNLESEISSIQGKISGAHEMFGTLEKSAEERRNEVQKELSEIATNLDDFHTSLSDGFADIRKILPRGAI